MNESINEYSSQSVCGYEDGIEYLILNIAYDDVNKDTMVKMAKSVIDK